MAGRSASAFPARYHDRVNNDVTSGVTSGGVDSGSAFEMGGVAPSLMEDPHYVTSLTEDERDLIAEVLNRDAKIKEFEEKRYCCCRCCRSLFSYPLIAVSISIFPHHQGSAWLIVVVVVVLSTQCFYLNISQQFRLRVICCCCCCCYCCCCRRHINPNRCSYLNHHHSGCAWFALSSSVWRTSQLRVFRLPWIRLEVLAASAVPASPYFSIAERIARSAKSGSARLAKSLLPHQSKFITISPKCKVRVCKTCQVPSITPVKIIKSPDDWKVGFF